MSPRKRLVFVLAVLVPAGFALKFYQGPAGPWVRDSLTGMLYEAFWIFGIALLWPRREKTAAISLGVFIVTCLLEFLQLWHPAWLERVRESFFGAVLLGTTFTWWDFPYYAAGCWISRKALDRILAGK